MAITRTISNHCMTLTMDRPEAKNALTQAMYDQLADGLIAAANDDQVNVVLLKGANGFFTSGNDLRDFQNANAEFLTGNNAIQRFMTALVACPKIVVAGVEGGAVGIGTTLLLHCDLVYAATNAQFSLPFIHLGLTPEFASSVLLERFVGKRKAAEYLLLGGRIPALTAYQDGLITRVLDDFDAELEQCVLAITVKSPMALQETKRLLARQEHGELRAVIEEENRVFARQLQSDAFRSASQAFFKHDSSTKKA